MIKRFDLAAGLMVPTEDEDGLIQVYVDPDPLERNILLTRFRIDDHTLSSALDPDEVSRIEFTADYTLLIWKRPTNYSGKDTFFFDVASIGLLLFPDRLVVISTADIQWDGMAGRQAPALHTALDVMLALLFSTTRHYLGHLKVIKMIAREVQQKINTSMENKHLIQMFNLSESLVYYINAINSNATVLSRLRGHAERESYPAASVALLDDLIIENNQCLKQAEIYSTVFSGLMDARGTLVNNNMGLLLKNLTIINIVFLPLNLIASIGGMSEYSMMTRGMDWRMAYALFCLGMVVMGLLTAFLLRRVGATRTARRLVWHSTGIGQRLGKWAHPARRR